MMLKERMFKVPYGVTFTTVTNEALTPLCFINVDNKPFRLRNLSETLNAEDNSYSTTLTGEWLGT